MDEWQNSRSREARSLFFKTWSVVNDLQARAFDAVARFGIQSRMSLAMNGPSQVERAKQQIEVMFRGPGTNLIACPGGMGRNNNKD